MIFKVGADAEAMIEAVIQTFAGRNNKVTPMGVVIREVKLTYTGETFQIGLKAADVDVIARPGQVSSCVYVRCLVILEPSSLAFNAEAANGSVSKYPVRPRFFTSPYCR